VHHAWCILLYNCCPALLAHAPCLPFPYCICLRPISAVHCSLRASRVQRASHVHLTSRMTLCHVRLKFGQWCCEATRKGVRSKAVACIRQNMYTADRNIPSSHLLALPCLLSCRDDQYVDFWATYWHGTRVSTRTLKYVSKCAVPPVGHNVR
jgi:hypothetical protein